MTCHRKPMEKLIIRISSYILTNPTFSDSSTLPISSYRFTILTIYSPMYSSTFPTFSHSLKILTFGYSVTILMFICTHISTNHICGHSVIIPICSWTVHKLLFVCCFLTFYNPWKTLSHHDYIKKKLYDFCRKGWYCNIESQLTVSSLSHLFVLLHLDLSYNVY